MAPIPGMMPTYRLTAYLILPTGLLGSNMPSLSYRNSKLISKIARVASNRNPENSHMSSDGVGGGTGIGVLAT